MLPIFLEEVLVTFHCLAYCIYLDDNSCFIHFLYVFVPNVSSFLHILLCLLNMLCLLGLHFSLDLCVFPCIVFVSTLFIICAALVDSLLFMYFDLASLIMCLLLHKRSFRHPAIRTVFNVCFFALFFKFLSLVISTSRFSMIFLSISNLHLLDCFDAHWWIASRIFLYVISTVGHNVGVVWMTYYLEQSITRSVSSCFGGGFDDSVYNKFEKELTQWVALTHSCSNVQEFAQHVH